MIRATLAVMFGLFATLSAAPVPVPKAEPKVKFELKWLENKAIEGLTEAKGFKTTCGEQLSYAHLKPAITNDGVKSAAMTTHDMTKNNLGVQHSIKFQITDEARKTIGDGAAGRKYRELAIFIDGKYWGTGIVRPGEVEKYEPFAGFISDKDLAEKIADAFKK